MADTGVFRGSGGVECTFDLPIKIEALRDQIAKGDLKPVDDAAKTYALSLLETPGMRTPNRDPEETPEPEPEPDPEPAVTERPPAAGAGSSRKAWAAYAESQGVTVGDDDTRDDIIAKVDG